MESITAQVDSIVVNDSNQADEPVLQFPARTVVFDATAPKGKKHAYIVTEGGGKRFLTAEETWLPYDVLIAKKLGSPLQERLWSWLTAFWGWISGSAADQ
jgi:hypothetical protein